MADMAAAWHEAMRRGEFETAWRISDVLLERQRAAGPCHHLPRHEQWVWDGTPLAGRRVLVRCYHGLGDTIMAARFLPPLAQQAREVTVWAQPALIPLLQTLAGNYTFLPLHNGAPDVDYDVDIESMELMHALRICAQTIPCTVPYFHVPPCERNEHRVGLLAKAGDWDPRRSVPTTLVAELARDIRNACSFQVDAPIPHALDASTSDIVQLARRLQAMHLVITVDTMLAHLAGALAVSTWLLLPFDADWRWMLDRTDSLWYPTMRLFRQPARGDWQSVLHNVRTALKSAA